MGAYKQANALMLWPVFFPNHDAKVVLQSFTHMLLIPQVSSNVTVTSTRRGYGGHEMLVKGIRDRRKKPT